MRFAAAAILLLSLFCGVLLAQKVELFEPQDTISDYADIVDKSTEDKIKSTADELRRITSVNLKVLVLRTIELVDTETYAKQLYDRWDIGQAKEGLEHGVLLLVSILDRKVKIVVGREVEKVLPAETRDKIEWMVLASLSRGRFSEGVELGAMAISQVIIATWPKTGPPGLKINWQEASLPLFCLFILSVAMTLVTGGGFLMAFSAIVGGLFGYVFLGNLGMVMGGALGFFLHYGRSARVKRIKAEGKKK
jgi:uncharacterized protein